MQVEPKFYTVKEFCTVARISRSTFDRLVKNGKINVARTSSAKNASIRIPISEIDKLMVNNDLENES